MNSEATCAHCGNVFKALRRSARFCGDRCRKRARQCRRRAGRAMGVAELGNERRDLSKGEKAMGIAMLYPEPAKRGRGNKADTTKSLEANHRCAQERHHGVGRGVAGRLGTGRAAGRQVWMGLPKIPRLLAVHSENAEPSIVPKAAERASARDAALIWQCGDEVIVTLSVIIGRRRETPVSL
jgi:hypothetical protein